MKKLNTNLQRIVNLLNDSAFHDGTSLGKKLNITRAGIWKLIQKLQDYGVEIESVKGKGYRLANPLILLEKNTIKKQIKTKLSIEVFETISSTMDYFKENHDHKNVKVCLAELQTAGRGRFNRKWHTPFAQNLALSLCYPFAKDISQLAGLSIIVGISICQSLNNYQLSDHLKLKWPNDILYDKKKLGGVLIEIEAETNGWCNAIIGLGLNANLQNCSKKTIPQPWTSLSKITGEYIDRNLLCGNLIIHLLDNLEKFSKEGLPPFISAWKTYDYLHGKKITIENFNKKLTGVAQGINASGHLLLQQKNKKIVECSSGDASISKALQK